MTVHARSVGNAPIVKGILFDFDGVLINSLPVMKLALGAALKETVPRHRGGIDALFQEYCKYLGMGFPQIMAELGLPKDMYGPFRRHSKYLAPYVTMYDGALDLLSWCQAQDLRLGIATGKDYERTCELLRLLGIDGFFHSVFGSDTVDNPKPAPEMASRFLHKHGLDPQEAILIGDAPADIKCGIAAGCQTAAAAWGYTPTDLLLDLEPNFVFYSVHDAQRQLSKLTRDLQPTA